MTNANSHPNRRDIIKRGAHVGLAVSAASIAGLGRRSWAQTSNDYKALVCIYLGGGNDHFNTVTPRSNAEYAAYASVRGNLAIAQNALLPITPSGFQGPQIGLHPSLVNLKRYFDEQRAALVSNIGVMVRPVTQTSGALNRQFQPVPLLSHNDQTRFWSTGAPDVSSIFSGWLGRIGDLVAPAFNNGSLVPGQISANGAASTPLRGETTRIYRIGNNGASNLDTSALHGSTIGGQMLPTVMTNGGANIFEQELSAHNRRSIDLQRFVSQTLAAAPPLVTPFPSSALGSELRILARMMGIRAQLGHRRQIFFAQLGGFDFHSELTNAQATQLATVDAALGAFMSAVEELGLRNNVTVFTGSDFGRQFRSNGNGTDHGWAGHQFVIGDAVRGGRVYGDWPAYDSSAAGAPFGGIPTTSIDAFGVTLARWFGVSDADLPYVMPNIARFPSNDLGFMDAASA